MSAPAGTRESRGSSVVVAQSREQTVRRQIMELLRQQELGARELSQAVAISEKEVYGHLTHIARSLGSQGQRLQVHQSRCRNCGFVFQDRQRLTRPGRCPNCKHGHLEAPRFHIG